MAMLPTASPSCLLVHYDEIGLKGKNRPTFEAALRQNLKLALGGGLARFRNFRGRILAELAPGTDPPAAARRAAEVFGVAYVLSVERASREIEALSGAIVERLRARGPAASFAVRAKRGDKRYPLTSMQVNAEIGRRIQAAIPMPVRLEGPALAVEVEVLEREAYFGFERVEGPGGLPVGISGRVACLLSGGIDSPVAAWLMMKRGCETVFVHFHSAPYTDRESQRKVRAMAADLARHQGGAPLWLVPFAPVQEALVARAPAEDRVVLYRRSMVRIAAAAAGREGALALVTGDSLGQVASQTLPNLAAIEEASPLPVLRPLLGWDKREIIAKAREIGTFETSIEPHQDCCSFLMPRRPTTRAALEALRDAESGLDLAALEAAALGAAVVERVG